MNQRLELDDLSYAQLVEEARRLIPTLAPTWTDHNPSDPGIALVEMFAWLTEMVLYRVNRIPDENYKTFLGLLNPPGWTMPAGASLEEAIRRTIFELHQPFRTVTEQDYEDVLLRQLPDAARQDDPPWTAPVLTRVRCLPERNLDAAGPPTTRAPGHFSVVLLNGAQPQDPGSDLTPELLARIKAFLDRRRLLTTKVHVANPRRIQVWITGKLYLRPDAVAGHVLGTTAPRGRTAPLPTSVPELIRAFLHPLTGGPDRRGRPFGHQLYISDLYPILAAADGVEAVTDLAFSLTSDSAQKTDVVDTSDKEVIVPQFANRAFATFVREGIKWVPTK